MEEADAVACARIEGKSEARFVSGRFEDADPAASGRGPFDCAALLAAGSGELEVAEAEEAAASGGEFEAVEVEDGESAALGSFDVALCGESDSSAAVVRKVKQAASDSTRTESPISQTAVLELADVVDFDAVALAVLHATKAVALAVVVVASDEQAGIH